MPSHGEGEQSTKLGGPGPYCPQPPLLWRLENDVPPLPPLVLVVGAAATDISKACCLDAPVESETDMAKLKLPAIVGVPETVPLLPATTTPWGSSPEATEKL